MASFSSDAILRHQDRPAPAPDSTSSVEAPQPIERPSPASRQSSAGAEPDAPVVSPDSEVAMAASTGAPSVLDRFALPSNFSDDMAGVKKRLAVVSVTKPKRTWWFRTHAQYVFEAGMLIDEGTAGRETYLLAPELVMELGDDVVRASLHGAITRQGVFFVIPVRLPGPDGRIDSWNASMREAVAVAAKEPVRTASNRDAGAYDIYTAPKPVEFPAWPGESWAQLLNVAFKDKTIEDLEHPVLRRLRGEV
jgi:hypothetical protein